MKWRVNFILIIIVFLFTVLFFRIFYIQTIKGSDYKKFLKKQIIKSEKIRLLRGNIYDRNGKILAFSNLRYSYFCFPKKVKSINEASNFISKNLNLNKEIFLNKIKKSKRFFWLTRKFETEIFDEIPSGIDRVKEEKRFYPNDSLASHVLGHVGLDNNGMSGIEYSFDKMLNGSVIKINKHIDAKGRVLNSEDIFNIENAKSHNIYLTIDENVQFIAEKNLAKMFEKNKPESATVIIQKIDTGEILAMANLPNFNPNKFVYDEKSFKNIAISKVYEPGSTLKVLVVGAALEENLITLEDKIYCEKGKFKIYDHTITDHDSEYGDLSVEDILAYSSNVGMAKIGEKLGKKMMYSYLQKFGFGCYTGIDLPGEEKGLLKNNREMYDISPYILAFGQGLAITPIQLISAFSAVANHGVLLEPRIIKTIETDGAFVDSKKRLVRKILSDKVCIELMNAMEQVVLKGTAKNIKMNGYRICGKTGTAQKRDQITNTYSEYDYIASFIGIFPMDNPQFTILVVADSPKGIYWGADVCGPVFKSIAIELASYYKIKRSF